MVVVVVVVAVAVAVAVAVGGVARRTVEILHDLSSSCVSEDPCCVSPRPNFNVGEVIGSCRMFAAGAWRVLGSPGLFTNIRAAGGETCGKIDANFSQQQYSSSGVCVSWNLQGP